MSAARWLFGALGQNGVLRLLGDAELQNALRRDLDLLSCRRVAADARLAIDDHELANAWEREAVPRFLVRERRELIEHQRHLLLRETSLFREPVQRLRLRDPRH